jgi:hypothetical protein
MDFEVIDIPMFNVVWGITMDMNRRLHSQPDLPEGRGIMLLLSL